MFVCHDCLNKDNVTWLFHCNMKSRGSCEKCEEYTICVDVKYDKKTVIKNKIIKDNKMGENYKIVFTRSICDVDNQIMTACNIVIPDNDGDSMQTEIIASGVVKCHQKEQHDKYLGRKYALAAALETLPRHDRKKYWAHFHEVNGKSKKLKIAV